MGMALALTAGFAAMGAAQLMAQSSTPSSAQVKTYTTLTAETREVNGATVATFSATVKGEDGSAAAGAVALVDGNKEIAGVALDSEGKATLKLDSLIAGDHTLHAVFHPEAATSASAAKSFVASSSESVVVHPQTSATPDFSSPALAPATLSLAAGAAGASVVTITAENGFTGFISLSCSGLPVGATCTFTPANLQIVAGTTNITADLTVQTTSPGGVKQGKLSQDKSASPLVLAVLLPGVLGLGFLGRKRKLLGRVMLLAVVGVLSVLATTACSPLYRYNNHPPTFNGGTPVGAYTLTVTAQTSNGVTATEHSSPLALTVTAAK
jgi:Big-like domain-containing protein